MIIAVDLLIAGKGALRLSASTSRAIGRCYAQDSRIPSPVRIRPGWVAAEGEYWKAGLGSYNINWARW
jgi:hypothetical protein